MTKTETALDNYLLERSWNDASQERVASLLGRLQGRMAELAMAKNIIEIGPSPLRHPMYLVRHKAKKLSFLERHFSEYIQDYFRSGHELN